MIQKIASLQIDIQTLNSIPSDMERKIDVDELMDELEQAIRDLIKLKILIFTASVPMRETILTLAETKSRISFLKGIDTYEGKNKPSDYSRYDRPDSEVEFSVEIDMMWVRDEIQISENFIDKMQDDLDAFNHKTEIKI